VRQDVLLDIVMPIRAIRIHEQNVFAVTAPAQPNNEPKDNAFGEIIHKQKGHDEDEDGGSKTNKIPNFSQSAPCFSAFSIIVVKPPFSIAMWPNHFTLYTNYPQSIRATELCFAAPTVFA